MTTSIRNQQDYRCPSCGAGLFCTPEGSICCGTHSFPLVDGLPVFVEGGKDAITTEQVVDSFSAQWSAWKKFPAEYHEFRKKWFLGKLGLECESDLTDFVQKHQRILDAGTGIGYKLELLGAASDAGHIHGVDISWSVVEAARNTAHLKNVSVARADIFHLPFAPASFDAIICDGVLHHTGDARAAFKALCRHLAAGGEMYIHVYRKMGPVREFTDDLIRDRVTRLSNQEASDYVRQLTEFGRSIAESRHEIEVPVDIPVLGIKKGRHNLQRFLYYVMFQCHWNPDLTFDQNNLINFDWYHPEFASRHTEEEVRSWFVECGLTEVRILHTNVKGVTACGRRPS